MFAPMRTAAAALSMIALAGVACGDELGGLEFDTVDANADGFVTFAEIQAIAPRASREQFDAFDADDDDRLDRADYEAWLNNFVGRD